MGDRQPFGKADRSMFGDRIRRRADLREQSGRRSGVEQIAAAALEHLRHQDARGPDMGEHVDLPNVLPDIIAHFRAAAGDDAGIGHEQVDRPDIGFDGFDKGADILCLGHVGPDRHATDVTGNRLRTGQIAVRADDCLCAFRGKAPRHSRSDPAGAAGDYDNLVFQFHFDLVPLE